MTDAGALRVELRASTWRLQLACWIVVGILTVIPSQRLAGFLVELIYRHGLRLLSFRVE